MKQDSKTTRLFRLLLCLMNGYHRTMEECTGFLDIKKSAFYSYINELKGFGFEVRQKEGKYWIEVTEKASPVLASLLHFSEEEAYVLARAIDAIEGNSEAALKLKQKLVAFLNRDEALDAYLKKEKGEVVQVLQRAISGKKQVLLKEYASGNSMTVADRRVEPFEFNDDFNLVYAWDTTRRENLQFKICRIGDVVEMPFEWKNGNRHRSRPVDVFRNSGTLDKNAVFEMNLRARNLLAEEYPLAEKYISEKGKNRFLFNAPVAKYEGPGRFVLGMAEDIVVKGDAGFTIYLKEKISRYIKLF